MSKKQQIWLKLHWKPAKKFPKKLSPQCTNSHPKEEMLIPTQHWFETGLYEIWYAPNTHLKVGH
jgi:hypothetical protein